VDALDTTSWLVALEGRDPGRVLRIGERRALNADGWFEAAPDAEREIFVWIEDGVVLIEDGVGGDDDLDESKRALDAEGRALGTERAEPLLCGDEFLYGDWRWRVVEMPPGYDPDPEEVKLRPRREALGGEPVWAPDDDHDTHHVDLDLDVTAPEPFRRPDAAHAEGTPLDGREAYVVGLSGTQAGAFFALDEELTFGRSPEVEVHVHHDAINRRHVRIVRDGSVARIMALGGTNPATLNNVRISSGRRVQALEHNDLIVLAGGGDVFVFKVLPVDDAPTDEQIASWITRWALERAEAQRLTRGGRKRER
jgi:hypothetical protein